MKQHEVEKLVSVIRSMAEPGGPARASNLTPPAPATSADNGHARKFSAEDVEKLYQQFKARFIDEARVDPILLHLITSRPEIVVDVGTEVIELEGKTLMGRLARLMAAGWFKDARATGAVRKELARTGADPGGGGTLSDTLGRLQRDGFLVREGDGWQIAPGVKVTENKVEN